MPVLRRFLPFVLLSLWLASPAAAQQQVSLSMRDGLVSLDARNASLRMVLAEWARVGHTVMVNLDKVNGSASVTLLLSNVPERQALDIVLRGAVAGFMVTPRPAADQSASRFDKVIILATSTAPPPQAAAPGPGGGATVSIGGRAPAPAYQPPAVQAGITSPDADGDFDDDEPGDHPRQTFPGNGISGRTGSAPSGMGTGSMPMQMPNGTGGMQNPAGMQGQPSSYRVPTTGYPQQLLNNPGGTVGMGPQFRPSPGTPAPGTTAPSANPFGVQSGTSAPGMVNPGGTQAPLSPTNPGLGGVPLSPTNPGSGGVPLSPTNPGSGGAPRPQQ